MLIFWGTTKKGLVRKFNEDRISIAHAPLFVLADGMGGYKGGEIASSLAVEVTETCLQKQAAEKPLTEEQIRQAVFAANDAVLQEKEKKPDLSRMGTTLAVAYFSQNQLVWASVGDSRIYLYHDGQLAQLTRDHSFVMDLLDKGYITHEEAQDHPRKNELTRAVGIASPLTVDTGTAPVRAQDLLLLCSDGLSSYVEDEQIRETVVDGRYETVPGMKEITEALLDKVYKTGAKDNVSIILASYVK
ncbi:MAG: Stp1/IreP family PP2C-type Ser/Thr phosphatase [Dialister sp.]|nr:Stp1/IreP family PP2C-type Ser/Thr phosphatase [Dialister sp.]